jgi:RND family efflux transporter MFP subunit
VAGLLGHAAEKGKAKAAPPMMQRPAQLVAVQKVSYQTEEDIRRYTGRLVSPSTVLIVPRVSGEIIEVGFKDGAKVKKGQILYKVDPVQYFAALKASEAKVEVCKANISQAKASIAQCKARLTYAKNNFDRNKALYDKKVVTQDTYESIKSEMDAATAATTAAEANLEAANASLLEANANLIKAKDDYKNTTIYAPMDALAGVTNKTVGNYVTPSTGTLVTLIQATPMRARFSVSMHDYLAFQLGEAKDPEVRMYLADGTEYKQQGKMELVNNEINKNTDTIQLFASFQNDEGLLFQGSTVRMNLHFRSPQKKLAVYPSCVMHDASSPYVYVVNEEGVVARRNVTLGLATSDWQFIKEGLKEGELVVKDGTNKIIPGDKVKTTEEDTVNRE